MFLIRANSILSLSLYIDIYIYRYIYIYIERERERIELALIKNITFKILFLFKAQSWS